MIILKTLATAQALSVIPRDYLSTFTMDVRDDSTNVTVGYGITNAVTSGNYLNFNNTFNPVLVENHFYDLYTYATISDDPTFKGWHFTSYDNPLLDPEEIKAAEKSMSSFSFRQEFMASFEAQGSELFKEDYIKWSEEEPKEG